MISATRILSALVFLSSLASGCVMADDEVASEATLEQAEGSATDLVVRPLDPPKPGTESASLDLSAPDPDGYVEGRLQVCKVAGAGGAGVYCDVWYCETHREGVNNKCEWTCGWSCEGSLDECEDVGTC